VPEGDTVYRTARRLDEALAGQLVTRSDFRVPGVAELQLRGERIESVQSRGKHVLMRVGELSIHSHLKMEGSWHLYRHGSKWRRPAYQARVVLETEGWVAVGFDLGVLDVVARDDEESVVGHLGPDLLGDDWDPHEAVRRLAADDSARPIHVALLDQRNLAGLGNEYANELCFLRGLLPTRPLAETPDLDGVVALAHRAIRVNRDRVERSFTGDTRPGKQNWVYRREGKPCRRCGTPIRRGQLGATPLALRDTYWCPRCQS
jgi:endonuclease-8